MCTYFSISSLEDEKSSLANKSHSPMAPVGRKGFTEANVSTILIKVGDFLSCRMSHFPQLP
jgi:hypothetical protein